MVFPTKKEKNALSLLLANKQVLKECLPILYQVNTFACDNTHTLFSFTLDAPAASENVGHISLPRICPWTGSWAFISLLNKQHLKSLTINSESILKSRADGGATLKGWVRALNDFLVDWHEAHKNAQGSSGVLRLVKFVQFEDYRDCEQYDENISDCKHIHPRRGSRHQKYLSDTSWRTFARWRRIPVCTVSLVELGTDEEDSCKCTRYEPEDCLIQEGMSPSDGQHAQSHGLQVHIIVRSNSHQ